MTGDRFNPKLNPPLSMSHSTKTISSHSYSLVVMREGTDGSTRSRQPLRPRVNPGPGPSAPAQRGRRHGPPLRWFRWAVVSVLPRGIASTRRSGPSADRSCAVCAASLHLCVCVGRRDCSSTLPCTCVCVSLDVSVTACNVWPRRVVVL